MGNMNKVFWDLTASDWIKLLASVAVVCSIIYFAGVQSSRLDIVEFNQRKVLVKLDELVRSDADLKAEVEHLKGKLEGKGLTGYSLMEGVGND